MAIVVSYEQFLNERLNEKKVELTVSLRYARKAQDIFNDGPWKKMGKLEWGDTYSFKNADDAEEFANALSDAGIPDGEYEINEGVINENANKEITKLENLLKLPGGSGVFQSVNYNDGNKTLVIEQPADLNPMDAGAVIAAINKEKPRVKKAYSGIRMISIGDIQITIQ
jgi:hypothetical protein